jgi:hypothetical protein
MLAVDEVAKMRGNAEHRSNKSYGLQSSGVHSSVTSSSLIQENIVDTRLVRRQIDLSGEEIKPAFIFQKAQCTVSVTLAIQAFVFSFREEIKGVTLQMPVVRKIFKVEKQLKSQLLTISKALKVLSRPIVVRFLSPRTNESLTSTELVC